MTFLFIIFIILVCPISTTFASVNFNETNGKDIYKLHEITKQVESLFELYGYPLNRQVNIYIIDNKKMFKKTLIQNGLSEEQANQIYNYSSAYTHNHDIYIIPTDLDLSEVQRELAHELVHQLQMQELGTAILYKMYFMEGFADYISYNLINYNRDLYDLDIPEKDISSYIDFKNSINKYGAISVYRQSQFLTEKKMKEIKNTSSIFDKETFNIFLKAFENNL